MGPSVAQNLFDRLLAINEEAFASNLFNAAYHALAGALHCADSIVETDQPLLLVSEQARRQLELIDKLSPEYEHSTKSSKNRSQSMSIFGKLSLQAETMVKMRAADRRWETVKRLASKK